MTGAAVALGGAAGALLRLALERLMPAGAGGWPWGTFTANVLGTALLGYLATRLLERLPPDGYRRPMLGTGLCGALTTFSALQVEAIEIAREGGPALAALYLAGSIGAGLALVALASGLVRRARLLPG